MTGTLVPLPHSAHKPLFSASYVFCAALAFHRTHECALFRFMGIGVWLENVRQQEQYKRQRQRRNAGVPFDFAQGSLVRCATRDETVSRFGRDDVSWGLVAEQATESNTRTKAAPLLRAQAALRFAKDDRCKYTGRRSFCSQHPSRLLLPHLPKILTPLIPGAKARSRRV